VVNLWLAVQWMVLSPSFSWAKVISGSWRVPCWALISRTKKPVIFSGWPPVTWIFTWAVISVLGSYVNSLLSTSAVT